jgi:hypothetical protein
MEALSLKRHAADSDWQDPVCFDGEWDSPGNQSFLLDGSLWGKPSWPASPSTSDHSWKRGMLLARLASPRGRLTSAHSEILGR